MLRRTRFGFLRAFVQQYGALKMSASGYDFGHIAEAARMANAVFILLGPRSRSHTSIIDALGWTPSMMTSRPSGSLLCIQCIPIEQVGERPASWFIQALPAGRDAVVAAAEQFDVSQWWNEVILTKEEGSLSRLDLVRIVRDRDGGAHLDNSITSKAYKSVLLTGAGFNYAPAADQPTQPVENSIEAIIRQIGFEVVHSLQTKYFAANIELQQIAATGDVAIFKEDPSP
ncbi:hypothetical protein AB8B02_05770 [Tardiphaga sp. 862_B3_N4_1]|uniref:hypothetical protein n=1 Tax=Tardiphaga sp. 862_B3_N4_1 TaxID=3240764 RepID=UPI003F22C3F5